MNTHPNDQPAFPRPYSNTPGGLPIVSQSGMTLRDYFAAHALQGMLANPSENAESAWNSDAVAAQWAYKLADAMLKERSTRS